VAAWLSIPDLQERWSASRSSVYRALAVMAREGYLRRMALGSDQRIALESVERYEGCREKPARPTARGASRTVPASALSAPGSTGSPAPFTAACTDSARVVELPRRQPGSTPALRPTLRAMYLAGRSARAGTKRPGTT
jgi:hypothetical protein